MYEGEWREGINIRITSGIPCIEDEVIEHYKEIYNKKEEKDNTIHIENANKEKDNSKELSKKKFTPPALAEVQAYCTERGNSVDAAHFVDYYTANGWHVGKQNMKDWKAAVRTWEHNGQYNGAKTQSRKTYEEIDYGSPEDFYR